tara:strand:- start:1558 stop:2184 length:627 start_codon:yes stop_codon:yes gene_type:complete
MTVEDRSHRDVELNPRSHPKGASDYDNSSKSAPWSTIRKNALLGMAEQKLINDIPRLVGPGNFANLGHARGGSAVLLGVGILEQGHTDSKIYSVDINFDGMKKKNELMDKYGVRGLIQPCKGSTTEFAAELKGLEFVFTFIDADHTYNSVVRDFEAWSPLIKKGGLVAFHDTHQEFSHQAVSACVVGLQGWKEREDLHVQTIRVFEKV